MDGSKASDGGLYVGLDIGYGNLKAVACDDSGKIVKTVVLPVGAAPEARCAKNMSGGVDVGDGASVIVGGERWVAGVKPGDLQDFARPTHEHYTKTREYLALFLAALQKIGSRHISRLATGLPVSQYYADVAINKHAELKGRLEGVHYLDVERHVTVEKVGVVPQPLGTYTDMVAENPNLAREDEHRTLVLDIGYYSADWVLMTGKSVLDQSSGSSADATSRIIEEAARQISHAHRLKVSPARVESAFRTGRGTLTLGGRDLDYKAYIGGASTEIAERVVSTVLSTLRSGVDHIDNVVITGGGGALYERAFRAAFPGSTIAVSADPVISNARGFMRLAWSNSRARAR